MMIISILLMSIPKITLKKQTIKKEIRNIQDLLENPYPEVIEDDSGAENISIESDQVRSEGVDEEPGPVSVDVHAVLFQQLLLVSPALRPVLRQLLHLSRRGGRGRWRKAINALCCYSNYKRLFSNSNCKVWRKKLQCGKKYRCVQILVILICFHSRWHGWGGEWIPVYGAQYNICICIYIGIPHWEDRFSKKKDVRRRLETIRR